MNFICVFGALFLTTYFVQIAMGTEQTKHFSQNYQGSQQLREVAIGRRAGRSRVGTVILFVVDPQEKILAVRKIQDATVLTKFHPLPQYMSEDIHYTDHYHPFVQEENKLTQQVMENAREIYLRAEFGNYQET